MNGIEFNSIDRFRQFKKEEKKEDRYENITLYGLSHVIVRAACYEGTV